MGRKTLHEKNEIVMERTRQPLDIYDDFPSGMVNYMRNYGKHFNKKMYEFAVSKMYKVNKGNNSREKMQPMTREDYSSMLSKYGVVLQNDVLYDGMYVASMAKSDFLGSSIPNEQYLAMYVKDYIDDPDQVDGFVFNRFYADCVLKGEPIEWDEML